MKQYQAKQLITISCCIDDLSPELYPYVLEKLIKLGANDAWFVPIIMKKGRPGIKLEVLLEKSQKDRIIECLFRETTTIGIRVSEVERIELDRKEFEIEVEGVRVRVKSAHSPDGEELNLKPEFEDCLLLSEKLKQPLKKVMARVNSF